MSDTSWTPGGSGGADEMTNPSLTPEARLREMVDASNRDAPISQYPQVTIEFIDACEAGASALAITREIAESGSSILFDKVIPKDRTMTIAEKDGFDFLLDILRRCRSLHQGEQK